MNIENQVAVVTGAGSGIGRAVAISLAQRGAKAVALVDRSDSVRAVAQSINDENGDGKKIAEVFVGDTTDETFQRKTFDTIVAEYGTPPSASPAQESRATNSPPR
jgi:NAD(P)-dependent dehydrogenase (short-subunit alcohol dehydrogenase family)